MVGGIVLLLFGRVKDKWNNPVVKKFVKLFPSAMAATITLGVAPLLFLQLVYHRQAYAASIVSGWFWLMIVVAALISYYLLYAASSRSLKGKSPAIYLWFSLGGLVYISVVYSSVFAMTERPDLISSLYSENQSGLVINPDLGSWVFRWAHMILGAVTVGSFFVGWLGRDDEQIWKVAKSFYLYAMIGTMIVGMIYLLSLIDILKEIMRSPAIWWMTVSIILSLGSLHFFFKKKIILAALMLFVSLLGMVVLRHYVRLIHLAGNFDPTTIRVQPEWSLFFIFLVCFIVAIGILWYMTRLFLAGRDSQTKKG
jgi:hypothetical protein